MNISAISYDDRTESDDAQMQEPRDRENVLMWVSRRIRWSGPQVNEKGREWRKRDR